jgi:ribonuclease HI
MMNYNNCIIDTPSIDSQNNTGGGGTVTRAAVLMFDGGARPPDSGESAIGFTLQIVGKLRREFAERIGRATCNESEYQALISGLRNALNEDVDDNTGRGDSQLVVRQVRCEW